jgi:hypothetical protein
MSIKTVASLIDVNICCEQVGNKRYDLVLIAAAKMREMRYHRMGTDKITRLSEVLLEIQEGCVDAKEYLFKVKSKKLK